MHKDNEYSDDDAIAGVIAGQPELFSLLLNRYRAYVGKIVSGFVPYEEVEDLAQEVFVEAYKTLPRFELNSSFKNWLAGIATHRCYDYLRRHYRNREIPLSGLTDDHQRWLDMMIWHAAGAQFSAGETDKDAREILHWALASLAPADRLVLTLVHLEELSIKEAAERLGWSRINVKVRAHRSRERLRKILCKLMMEGGSI